VGDRQLRLEILLLQAAVEPGHVEVQSDFAECDRGAVAQALLQVLKVGRPMPFEKQRMQSVCGNDAWVTPAQRGDAWPGRRIDTRYYHHPHAGFGGTRQDLGAVAIETRIVDMDMAVDQQGDPGCLI
jgi:hypothetical protein